MTRERLDVVLVEKGLFPSREKAKAAVMAGLVKVDGQVIDKAGTRIDREAAVTVLASGLKYVSRGGLKLEKAISCFHLNLQGKTVLDIGASTGGFTDCSLKNGAIKVYAVDVGYGQLDWKLRQDNRVVVLERVNARYLSTNEIMENIDMVTIDVSFISLTKIFPVLKKFMHSESFLVTLIKPQFEAGREKVGKKGVVRDPAVHAEVLSRVISFAGQEGFFLHGLTFSPVTGPEGNIEYLGYFCLYPFEGILQEPVQLVKEAFECLKKTSSHSGLR